MPAVIFSIGVLSIILVIWVYRISESQQVNAALDDAVRDVKVYTVLSHLWLEEVFSGDTSVDTKEALAYLGRAERLVDIILIGGKSRQGWVLHAQEDPKLKRRTEEIKPLLARYRELVQLRLQRPEISGVGSDADQRFDAVFKEVLRKAAALEAVIETYEMNDRIKSKRLFFGILIAWMFIVIAATVGLWTHERRRRSAEHALLQANRKLLSQSEELTRHRDNLTEMVEKRTAELMSANKLLQIEVAERTQAEVALKASARKLRFLSTCVMSAQETERRSISRELHDELGHSMTLMKLRLISLWRALPDRMELREECDEIVLCVDQIIEDVRRISRSLSPTKIEDLGFTAAVQCLVENFRKNFGGTIKLDIENVDHLLSEDAWTMIYRVLQEAVTNIGKHSSAENASVVVRSIGDKVSFYIEDNGRGFDPLAISGADSSGKGLGLTIMEERVRMLGGSIEISSEGGKGTRVTFSIPARKEQHA